jgi:hypothetical protein
MNHAKYEPLLISKDGREFKFISDGPKGKIQKIVQFIETQDPAIYNLAFGDLLPDGQVDDHIKNDNKDRNKVLATVAATVFEFTARNLEKFVFFTGSTPERTRLYRIALAINLEELCKDFEIFGMNMTRGCYYATPFLKGVEYSGFLVKRKRCNLVV